MTKTYKYFEDIARNACELSYFLEEKDDVFDKLHPFEERNIHPELDNVARKLFDDGHYAQATFEAFKYIDEEVQKLSKLELSGVLLIKKAFDEKNPLIKLNELANKREINEQKGYKSIFEGAMQVIRNPRAHKTAIPESPDECLDHISFASLLLRRLPTKKPI